MRIARLAVLDRAKLVDGLVVVRVDREIDICIGFVRNIVKSLDRGTPRFERFRQGRVVLNTITGIAGSHAAPDNADMTLVAVLQTGN